MIETSVMKELISSLQVEILQLKLKLNGVTLDVR